MQIMAFDILMRSVLSVWKTIIINQLPISWHTNVLNRTNQNYWVYCSAEMMLNAIGGQLKSILWYFGTIRVLHELNVSAILFLDIFCSSVWRHSNAGQVLSGLSPFSLDGPCDNTISYQSTKCKHSAVDYQVQQKPNEPKRFAVGSRVVIAIVWQRSEDVNDRVVVSRSVSPSRYPRTNMSSGFVTETELAERRKVRQEEWDRVRTAEQPVGTFVSILTVVYCNSVL